MRTTFPFVVSLLLIVSCKNAGQSASSAVSDKDNAEVIEIPELKDSALMYSDFCSRVEYIPLEAADQSILGLITKMAVASDGSFIVFDVQNALLLRFGPYGKFLNRIGRVGNKDGEYIQITDFAYNPHNSEVIVWHHTKSELLYYDLDGNYLRRSELKCPQGRISVLDDSHLALYVSEKKGDTYLYKYVITSFDGNEVIAEYLDNEPNPQGFTFHLHYFNTVNGRTHCKPEYSSSIYELSEKGLIPVYSISYSDKTIPPKWFKMDEWSFWEKLSKAPRTVFCEGFYETPNYYLISSPKQYNRFYLSVQERFGGRKTFSGSYMLDDMFWDTVISDLKWSRYTTVRVLCVEGNAFYSTMEARPFSEDEYTQLCQKICSEVTDSTERSIILSKWEQHYRISQNENPYLIKCTLK